MKLLLLAFTTVLFFSINSQITVTSADFGNSEDTVRLSKAADLNVDFATTGPDQIWDYSNLVAGSQYLKTYVPMGDAGFIAGYIFGPFAASEYQGSYFLEIPDLPIDQIGQFLPVSIDNFYQVSKVAADSVTSIGNIISVASTLVPVKSDTIETRYALPLEYGNTHFSRGYTYMDLSAVAGIIWLQHRSRNTEVDGFGVITTPFGTFNALRVRHDIQETDSVFIDYNGFSFWLPVPLPMSHEYEWWTNGQMDPILKITTSEVQGNENVTAVEYRDIYRGLDAGISEQELQLSIYPNPTSDKITVNSAQAISSIVLYANNGVIAKRVDGGQSTEVILDLSDLPQGIYLIEVIASNKRQLSFVVRQ